MARNKTPKRSPFAVVADTLTQIRISTKAASAQEAFDLLDLARAWPHFVDGQRYARPDGTWIVEIQSRRRQSKEEFHDWLAQANKRHTEREREAARLRRAEAKATAEREREYHARLREATAAIAAAQASAPPGPKTAYVYNEGENRAGLVRITARAGVLVARRRGKGYAFTHEPTGLDLPAPGREEVKTQERALELLGLAARPAVVAALDAALSRGAPRDAVERFYAAWTAGQAHAPTTPRPRTRQRSISPFADVAGALAAALGSCADCRGTGTVQDGQVAVYCTCPVGQQLHDRELALAWGPAETEHIVQFLERRAAADADTGAKRALKTAARELRRNGFIRNNATKSLLGAASKGSVAARAALRAAAVELARGAHLPPAPLPATPAETRVSAEAAVAPAATHAKRRLATT